MYFRKLWTCQTLKGQKQFSSFSFFLFSRGKKVQNQVISGSSQAYTAYYGMPCSPSLHTRKYTQHTCNPSQCDIPMQVYDYFILITTYTCTTSKVLQIQITQQPNHLSISLSDTHKFHQSKNANMYLNIIAVQVINNNNAYSGLSSYCSQRQKARSFINWYHVKHVSAAF